MPQRPSGQLFTQNSTLSEPHLQPLRKLTNFYSKAKIKHFSNYLPLDDGSRAKAWLSLSWQQPPAPSHPAPTTLKIRHSWKLFFIIFFGRGSSAALQRCGPDQTPILRKAWCKQPKSNQLSYPTTNSALAGPAALPAFISLLEGSYCGSSFRAMVAETKNAP